MRFHKTRFPFLVFSKIDNKDWSFFAVNEGGSHSRVGPIYSTKEELLFDLDRYARESWGEG